MQSGSPVNSGETGSIRCEQGQPMALSLGHAESWQSLRWLAGDYALFDSIVSTAWRAHALRQAEGCP
ncbi:MAG: hypothetical protein KatS3mg051_0821 [Anaerolineae bacterium]|nr:MAG: hypothetical protein KatS3mg051_0821 [Anaerolineae bacterium]